MPASTRHTSFTRQTQQKWVEGTNLEDIGQFLQSWAPEPYRNKPMPQEMLQRSTPGFSTQFPGVDSGRLVELHFSKHGSCRFCRRSSKGTKKSGYYGGPCVPQLRKRASRGNLIGTHFSPYKNSPRKQKRLALRRRTLAGHPRGCTT